MPHVGDGWETSGSAIEEPYGGLVKYAILSAKGCSDAPNERPTSKPAGSTTVFDLASEPATP